MATLLVKLHLSRAEATAGGVKERLGLSAGELDEAFGVVCLDERAGEYAVLLEEQAAARVQGLPGVAGRYANPKIAPFGPPGRRGAGKKPR